jgi:hypothetical protein
MFNEEKASITVSLGFAFDFELDKSRRKGVGQVYLYDKISTYGTQT